LKKLAQTSTSITPFGIIDADRLTIWGSTSDSNKLNRMDIVNHLDPTKRFGGSGSIPPLEKHDRFLWPTFAFSCRLNRRTQPLLARLLTFDSRAYAWAAMKEAANRGGPEGYSTMADENVSCSCCQRSKDDVKHLLAGPSMAICDECPGDLSAILAEEHSDWRDAAN
jgi:hypothetical protein